MSLLLAILDMAVGESSPVHVVVGLHQALSCMCLHPCKILTMRHNSCQFGNGMQAMLTCSATATTPRICLLQV
jgi:hypothetical protein